MAMPGILQQRDFKRFAVVIGVVTLVYLAIILFAIGGDVFIFSLSSSLNAPLAITVTITAISAHRFMGHMNQSRRLWMGFILGWGLWALAETLWLLYFLVGQELPYPSWADFFWVSGYIPLGYGLISRIRSLPAKPTQRQTVVIALISAAIIIVTAIFLFIPIFQSFDVQNPVTSLLNIIYPLADLVLVILVWRLFFAYEKGDFGFSWRLLAVGFLLMTSSDFLFTYADWQEMYYPDMQANLLSRFFIDAPYTLSYFAWVLGIVALRLLLKQPPEVDTINPPRRVPFYGHILLSTRGDDTIIDFTPNAVRLFDPESIKGKRLSELLHIPEKDEQAILAKLMTEGRLADLSIQTSDREGIPVALKLCGLVVWDSKRNYAGCNILLRVLVDDYLFDNALSDESRGLIGYVLEKSGSSYSVERANFLLEYHLLYMNELVKLAYHEGGETLVNSLLDELKKLAAANQWKLLFSSQTGLARSIYPISVMQQALPVLLEASRQFVCRVIDPETVETRMKEVSAQLDDWLHKDAARFLKSGAEI